MWHMMIGGSAASVVGMVLVHASIHAVALTPVKTDKADISQLTSTDNAKIAQMVAQGVKRSKAANIIGFVNDLQDYFLPKLKEDEPENMPDDPDPTYWDFDSDEYETLTKLVFAGYKLWHLFTEKSEDKMFLAMELSRFNSLRDITIAAVKGINFYVSWVDYQALRKTIRQKEVKKLDLELHKQWIAYCDPKIEGPQSKTDKALCDDIKKQMEKYDKDSKYLKSIKLSSQMVNLAEVADKNDVDEMTQLLLLKASNKGVDLWILFLDFALGCTRNFLKYTTTMKGICSNCLKTNAPKTQAQCEIKCDQACVPETTSICKEYLDPDYTNDPDVF